MLDLVQLFKDDVTVYFNRTKAYLEGKVDYPPPRLTTVLEKLHE